MSLWNDLTPSKRCDWIDQLRGWAVIVMIEVHAVNVWLHAGLRPDWLQLPQRPGGPQLHHGRGLQPGDLHLPDRQHPAPLLA